MTHPGLGGEMDHLGETLIGKQCGHAVTVAEIELVKPKLVVMREFGEAGLFESRIVVGIEVVDADHVAPILQQTSRHVESDKSRDPSDQDRWSRHVLISSHRRRRIVLLRLELRAIDVSTLVKAI